MYNCLPNHEKFCILKIKDQNNISKYNLIINNIVHKLMKTNDYESVCENLDAYYQCVHKKLKTQNNIIHINDAIQNSKIPKS